MDKFLLAENPMSGDALAIVHMADPKSILLVDVQHIATQWPHEHYTYKADDGSTQRYTLSLYHCATSVAGGDAGSAAVTKLFQDAWQWYVTYIKWEDQNIGAEW